MDWISRLYIIFLGLLLSLTTGFGLAAFYPQPQQPASLSLPHNEIISQSCYTTPENQSSPQCVQAFQKQKETQMQLDSQQKKYMNIHAGYTRTAIFFGIVFGSLFAISGLTGMRFSKTTANGLLFAAVLSTVFMRLLINLASLGGMPNGSNSADVTAYTEFLVLIILSSAFVIYGFINFTERGNTKKQ